MDAQPPLPGPGEVNMADVARRAGVSIATVSRALRGVPGVRPDTRDRIRSVAEELAYVVSPEASALARGTTGRVAVVMPRLDVWFYSTMLAGIEAVLRSAELDVLVYQIDGEEQRTRFFRDLPARRKVDAVVLAALPMTQAEHDRLELMGVHVVVAGGRLRSHPRVEVDDHAIGALAVDHLADLGHERIAMVRTSDTDGTAWSSDLQRTQGFRDQLAARGLELRPELLVTVPFGLRAGAAGMGRLLELPDPPTAVFAYSDEIAVSAWTELVRRGVDTPGQVSVLGVDGHPTAELLGVTTITQDVEVQARLAGELALGLLRGEVADDDPRGTVLVPHRLVDRGTTGPAPAGPAPTGPAPSGPAGGAS